ncbi:hypothetical protein SAMN02982922_5839 [Mesorhizobium australicum]|uniref:Uncharacterized protein n=2 Tax=Mesorhizobium australicum TaxID=536018 RepID=A0A1X7PZ93_9HYPH|nr:hypothetical protein SAMN02982922_5839 [Mesorhizobium australicum]
MTDRPRRLMFAEGLLPPEILSRGSLRGNEYAWPVDDIPMVIAAAEKASLISLGGQLQFRLSDGGTCECYWVDVDIGRSELVGSNWAEKVRHSGQLARERFMQLRERFDFLHEGRTNFQPVVEAEARGDDLSSAMCFVWYVEDQTGRHGFELN